MLSVFSYVWLDTVTKFRAPRKVWGYLIYPNKVQGLVMQPCRVVQNGTGLGKIWSVFGDLWSARQVIIEVASGAAEVLFWRWVDLEPCDTFMSSSLLRCQLWKGGCLIVHLLASKECMASSIPQQICNVQCLGPWKHGSKQGLMLFSNITRAFLQLFSFSN